ncbi:3-phenylpropionate/cinnamic acid dioxygenase subunit beta [Actinomadura rupiterrae]|uniref:3-phenylpropionate/cinnamic acid dioxygenase subunit beta n=1 Tax=Actinomadura rupiterrae TaxID=559627 RepID=UPI0020A2D1DE|nr:3-phenylpropionate/cinnamic acid dioxygenase subunit beta [Actinomadura rupiterrae]MCP2338684.1 ethylbenzene dioxygenase beta subunit [Actinomadura rupiterrae]
MTPATTPATVLETADRVDAGLYVEVLQFVAREARLLDEERYPEWLALFTEDATYWVPGIENRSRHDRSGTHAPERMAYFDDTIADLRHRVDRFTAPTAWAEDPATRHLHVVSNVEVEAGEAPDELTVRSVFVNHRGQGSTDSAVLYGRRTDRLRRVEGRLRIAARKVVLSHATLPAKNINTFF